MRGLPSVKTNSVATFSPESLFLSRSLAIKWLSSCQGCNARVRTKRTESERVRRAKRQAGQKPHRRNAAAAAPQPWQPWQPSLDSHSRRRRRRTKEERSGGRRVCLICQNRAAVRREIAKDYDGREVHLATFCSALHS